MPKTFIPVPIEIPDDPNWKFVCCLGCGCLIWDDPEGFNLRQHESMHDALIGPTRLGRG